MTKLGPLFIIPIFLTSCLPIESNYPSLHTFQETPRSGYSKEIGKDSTGAPITTVHYERPTDESVLAYSSYLADQLFIRSRDARIAREASNSTVLGLAAATAAGPSFGFAEATLVKLGIAGATIGSYQNLFKAKERSKHFQSASMNIRKHIQSYHAKTGNGNENFDNAFSAEAATLLLMVNQECELVYNHLTDNLPSQDMMAAYIISFEDNLKKIKAARSGGGNPTPDVGSTTDANPMEGVPDPA